MTIEIKDELARRKLLGMKLRGELREGAARLTEYFERSPASLILTNPGKRRVWISEETEYVHEFRGSEVFTLTRADLGFDSGLLISGYTLGGGKGNETGQRMVTQFEGILDVICSLTRAAPYFEVFLQRRPDFAIGLVLHAEMTVWKTKYEALEAKKLEALEAETQETLKTGQRKAVETFVGRYGSDGVR
jgi:hypothetical protein